MMTQVNISWPDNIIHIILTIYFIADIFENGNHTLELKPCPICNRKFNTTAYDKHVIICSTTASKKRKIFDSSRQRRDGTELASYLPRNFGLPVSKITDTMMSLKEAQNDYPIKRTEKGSKKSSNAYPVSNSTSLQRTKSTRASIGTQPQPSEQCPHCQRFFGSKAYDRHVEWCKEKAIQQAIKNPGSNNVAKDRLFARTKYRAPCLKYPSISLN